MPVGIPLPLDHCVRGKVEALDSLREAGVDRGIFNLRSLGRGGVLTRLTMLVGNIWALGRNEPGSAGDLEL